MSDMSQIGMQFSCKCGKQEAIIMAGQTTPPCPICGRIYYGKYNKEYNAMKIIEKKPSLSNRLHLGYAVGITDTQTFNCKICIQINSKALFFGNVRKDDKPGLYIRIFTPSFSSTLYTRE